MARLEDKLAALKAMSPVELRATWRSLTKSEPPRFGTALLRHALGHRIQESAMGGMTAATLRQLRRGGADDAPSLTLGTRLMRSWHGRTIAVTVTESGFEFDGRSYRSLTAIACAVTGVRWSGPRFFGLQAGQSNG